MADADFHDEEPLGPTGSTYDSSSRSQVVFRQNSSDSCIPCPMSPSSLASARFDPYSSENLIRTVTNKHRLNRR